MRLDAKMATKSSHANGRSIEECTEFSVRAERPGTVDFVEVKLMRAIKDASSSAIRESLFIMVEKYRVGAIAVGFWHGEPTFIPITKNG